MVDLFSWERLAVKRGFLFFTKQTQKRGGCLLRLPLSYTIIISVLLFLLLLEISLIGSADSAQPQWLPDSLYQRR